MQEWIIRIHYQERWKLKISSVRETTPLKAVFDSQYKDSNSKKNFSSSTDSSCMRETNDGPEFNERVITTTNWLETDVGGRNATDGEEMCDELDPVRDNNAEQSLTSSFSKIIPFGWQNRLFVSWIEKPRDWKIHLKKNVTIWNIEGILIKLRIKKI